MTIDTMIDLRDKDRKAICTIAEQIFVPGTEIWVYGSRVKGTNHDTSDLDLVVHFPPDQDKMTDYEQLSLFLETLRDSNIPIIVQALAWHSIPDTFREEIDKKHQLLWRCQ
ncbi:nucleotidyltransferase family protein [Endozoicomonas acroporae]|uniref:nucleotidyltransferase family protein n=1 Tax=Endozoicomonas acroporae TaxID=1701104 RepID=UPI003D7A2080